MGCASSNTVKPRNTNNHGLLENDGTVVQDLEDDISKEINQKYSGEAITLINGGGLHIDGRSERKTKEQPSNGYPPSTLEPKKPIAFNIDLGDGKIDLTSKRLAPRRLQRLEPLPGAALTAEALREKQREAEARHGKELQKRARSAQQSARRRARILRRRHENVGVTDEASATADISSNSTSNTYSSSRKIPIDDDIDELLKDTKGKGGVEQDNAYNADDNHDWGLEYGSSPRKTGVGMKKKTGGLKSKKNDDDDFYS